ncbi:Na+/H+ antiporter OS=Streptomyces microflavus OX=1919 GN=Smic_56060 PE=3 SV=1 [Streptomyces microflavus]
MAAEARLDELLADPHNSLPPPLADRLRSVLDRRRNAVWERLGTADPAAASRWTTPSRRLSREMIEAEREVFVRLRDERRIDDEMMRTLLRRLDLEEAAAYRETDDS